MKPTIFTLLLCTLLVVITEKSEGQALELIGGNTVNGAITGTALGAATMGLKQSDDFKHLRIGLGLGILGGTAVTIYDITTLPSGQQFYISGMMNDGYNSTIIILLDTIYGAAAGTVVGAGISLVADRPILEGVRTGSGIGAWSGFGIGLLDAFVIADRNRDLMTASSFLNRETLLTLSAGEDGEIGLIRPTVMLQRDFRSGDLALEFEPVLELFSYRVKF